MAHYSEVTMFDFQKVLTPTNVKGLQIIHIALVLGIFFFAGMVAFLSVSFSKTGTQSGTSIVRMLSYAHLMTALILYVLSNRIYNRALEAQRPMDSSLAGQSAEESRLKLAERFFQSIRTAVIIRLALLEGVALFGLTICLIASTWGVIQIQPIYWLNALSSLAFIVYAIGNLPTKARLEKIFREKRSAV